MARKAPRGEADCKKTLSPVRCRCVVCGRLGHWCSRCGQMAGPLARALGLSREPSPLSWAR